MSLQLTPMLVSPLPFFFLISVMSDVLCCVLSLSSFGVSLHPLSGVTSNLWCHFLSVAIVNLWFHCQLLGNATVLCCHSSITSCLFIYDMYNFVYIITASLYPRYRVAVLDHCFALALPVLLSFQSCFNPQRCLFYSSRGPPAADELRERHNFHYTGTYKWAQV